MRRIVKALSVTLSGLLIFFAAAWPLRADLVDGAPATNYAAGTIPATRLGSTYTYYPSCDLIGVVDCSNNIQNAINVAQNAGGGTIQLPCTGSGAILVNAGVTISNGGIHLKGCGFEEFKGYQFQSSPQRGITGTYINTTSTAQCPINVAAGANAAVISDLAFTQSQPAEPATIASFTGSISGTTLTTTTSQSFIVGQVVLTASGAQPSILYNTTITGGSGTSWTVSQSQTITSQAMTTEASAWTPTVYPASICHAGGPTHGTSAGRLEVYRVLFAGVYDGIRSGTQGAGVGQSLFTGRDYYHNINGAFFGTGVLAYASSDVFRIEDFHAWPVYFPAYQSSPNILAYMQANTEGILSARNDNPIFSNVFFFGVNRGIHFNGGNPDGVTQGAQINNIDCDSTHNCMFFDNTTGSTQYTAEVANLSFTGFSSTVCCDTAVQTFSDASNVAISVVNANLINTYAYMFNIAGTGNTFTLTNARASLYNQANGGFQLINVGSGNTGYSFGKVQVSNNNSTGVCSANCFDVFNDAWTAFTASASCGTASLTTNGATYKQSGKSVSYKLDVSVSTLGTCATTNFSFNLPTTPLSIAAGAGRDGGVGGIIGCAGASISMGCTVSIAPTGSSRFIIGGTYESQ